MVKWKQACLCLHFLVVLSLKVFKVIFFEYEIFKNSEGIDGGGIFKEFLNELIVDAFDPQRGLFEQTENHHELYPNPNYLKLSMLMNVDKDYFQFLGKMVGKALYDSVLIEPIFAQFFLRYDFHLLIG